MFKIGLFTFGGGYAMIAILEDEFVDKKKWVEREEFTDMIAISESTPGPIAINSATYIGYKIGGFFGSLAATIGVCIPPVTIIFLISLFFEQFLALKFVSIAFKGINVCVTFLILSAGVKMFVKSKKSILSYVLFSLSTIFLTAFTLFGINFSTIYFILIGAAIGLLYYVTTLVITKCKNSDDKIKDNIGKKDNIEVNSDIAQSDCNLSDNEINSKISKPSDDEIEGDKFSEENGDNKSENKNHNDKGEKEKGEELQ